MPMQITKQEIAAVKRSHDLIEVIESYGVKLRKKGGSYVGLCPFHQEKTPSFTVNPRTNLYHCFGCNAGGDVIGFVCKKEGIGFREAVQRLVQSSGVRSSQVQSGKKNTQDSNSTTQNSKLRTRLLNRVVSFYHKTFCEDQRAAEYLRSRAITDNSIFPDFRIGFSNGTLLNTIPEDGDVQDAIKEIGILNGKGHEMFYGCVIFPIFDENKDCVGLYGRRITNPSLSPLKLRGDEGGLTHLYLPGPRKGVFNYQAAKRSKSLILTESIIDALTLYNAGFKDVIPCYGVNGLTEDHLNLFTRYQTKEFYLCFDRDDAGNQGAERIAGQLRDKGIDSYIVNLPSSESQEKVDINSFFLSTVDAPLIFEKLLKEANSRASIRSDKVIKQKQKHYEKTDVGFIVQYGERRYEVRGITREGVKLKATIKAIKQPSEAKSQRFHLDTVDLNSNRSRLFFGKACAVLFGEKEELILEDMTKLIDLAESWRPEEKESASLPKMSQSDEEEVLEFLKDSSLFNRILEDFETIGFTGEEANKLMGYISATSRKLDEPLSILIQSRSAAGKSALQDAVMMLIPPEDHARYTRLTGQALFYKEENSLAHKLLAIEEEHGARDASYSIRNIQSSKYLSIAATGKDPLTGKLRTEEYRVKGPVALMITTTEVELDYETSNRFITLSIDESREMTERILKKQREQETLEGLIKKAETERIIRRHHNAQRLLRPLQVINPYASYLSYPSDSLRARRDHKKYLGLIKAIAFLHQYQREIKTIGYGNDVTQFIEVIFDDIEKANRLANEVLGRCLDELSPPSRLLLKMIREMVETRCKELKIEPKDYRFTRRDIREWTRWSDFQIKCHIRQLEDLEYIYSVTGKKGKEYVYELLYPGGGEDGRPFLMGLTTIEQLKEKLVLSGAKELRDPSPISAQAPSYPQLGGQKRQLGGYLEGTSRALGGKG
jgi:DNA primase catalytic core